MKFLVLLIFAAVSAACSSQINVTGDAEANCLATPADPACTDGAGTSNSDADELGGPIKDNDGKDKDGKGTGSSNSAEGNTPTPAALTTLPQAATNQNGATIDVGGSDIKEYRYVLQSDPTGDCADVSYPDTWTTVDQEIILTDLTDGTKRLCLIGRDGAGIEQTEPTVYEWVVDTAPPVVSAGADTVASAAVTLTGTASENGIYQWTQISGPGTLVFSAETSVATSVTSPADGSYVVRFTVVDAAGNVSFDEMTLLWDTNVPAVAAGADLSANASTTLASAITGAQSQLWSKTSGPGTLTFGAPTATTTSVTADVDGTYVVRVTATSPTGVTGFDELTLVWDATPPQITALADVAAAATITKSATVTGATSYQWTQQSGPGTLTFGSATAASTTVAASADGNYVVRLTATDALGNAADDEFTLTWDTTAPTVDAGIDALASGTVTLTGTASGATIYQWSKHAGPGTVTFGTPSALSTTVSASSDGIYTLRLTVTNALGVTSHDDMTFERDTAAPIVNAGADLSANAAFTRNATVTGAATYQWSKQAGTGTITFGTATAAGTTISASADDTYVIRLTATDAAGNSTYDDFSLVWDTAPPTAPTFTGFSPPSPSSTATPTALGSAAADTATLTFYDGNTCANQIGAGTRAAFIGTGIALTVAANDTTTIYAKAADALGNGTVCTSMGSYVHDDVAPGAPSFVSTSPISPSASSTTPAVAGATGAGTATVKLYDGNTCANEIGSGTQAAFNGAGIAATVTANATTTLYAKAFDAAGNASACTSLTSYTHDDVAPDAPSFTSTSPVSPSRLSSTPAVTGATGAGTTTVKLYDGNTCANEVGSGTQAAFNGAGITATVTANATTALYAKAFDGAGNGSACTSLAAYSHDDQAPSAPTFSSTSPASPSAASSAPAVIGTASSDTVTVRLYDGNTCANEVGSGTKAAFQAGGITATLTANATTSLYAKALDAAGNATACTSMTSYTHDATPPPAPNVTGTATVTTTTPTWSWTSGGSDGSGTFRYKLNSTDFTGVTETTDTSFMPGSALAETAHILYVQERDALGNWSPSGSFTTTINSTPTAVSGVSSNKSNGTYGATTAIDVRVTFTASVTVTGTPQLTLETGATDRVATYASGSPGTTLVFTYTVQDGDSSADLTYVSTSALALNGGSIKDGGGIDAILTLPAPTATGSLAANKDLVIDTTPAGICSSGSFAGNCTVTTAVTIGNGASWNVVGDLTLSGAGAISTSSSAHTATIAVGGDLLVSAGTSINANLSALTVGETMTVQSGGAITGDIALLSSTGAMNVAGTVTGNLADVTAPSLTISGTMTANGRGYKGVLKADGNGYAAQKGGKGHTGFAGGCGGGHAGSGGDGSLLTNYTDQSYGSATAPVTYGSAGGGAYTSAGGDGGGAIKITVSGTLTIGGTLSANGVDGASGAASDATGGGAGGSLWITTQGLAGSGTISAKGGNGGASTGTRFGGGGSGGRISLTSPTKFAGTINASGGTASGLVSGTYKASAGSAGSYYQSIGNLCDSGSFAGNCTISSRTAVSNLDQWVITGNLTFAGATTLVPAATGSFPSITAGGDVEVAAGATVNSGITLLKGANLSIPATGAITGDVKSIWMTGAATIAGTITGNVAITTVGNLTVSGAINATGKGYAVNVVTPFDGIGSGTGGGFGSSTNSAGGNGGAHGGAGGRGYSNAGAASVVYGATGTHTPLLMGSAGGGCGAVNGGLGGGVIRLNVGGTLAVSGSVTANGTGGGTNSTCGGGGGAGGSIWISAANMSGAGIVTAKGGDGGSGSKGGGAGGGGRVRVDVYTADSFNGTKSVVAGTNGTNAASSPAAGVQNWPAAPAAGARHALFATSATYNGDLGGLAGADAKCQRVAESGGLFGRWTAVVSTASTDAYTRLDVTGNVHNLNNQALATSLNDLFDGSLTNTVAYNELFAAVATEVRAWTGTTSSGSVATNTCGDFTTGAAGTGTAGDATATNGSWVQSADVACTTSLRLYCLNQ